LNGHLIWFKYYIENGLALNGDIDDIGNVIVSTYTNTNGFSTVGSQQSEINGGYDYLLTKLDNQGNLIWSTYYGGENDESLYSCSSFFDSDGNVFLIGGTNSETSISSENTFQELNNGLMDGMVVKFDAVGNRIWASYFGGNLDDIIYDGFVDNQGNVYLIGESKSESLLVNSSAFQNVNYGEFDGLIGKFSSDGNLLWSTLYGDSLHEEIIGIDVDDKGNVWISGFTNSENIATNDGFQAEKFEGLSSDLFLAKFDSIGNRLWASYYGGEAQEYRGKVAIGIDGDVFLSGNTFSQNNISTSGAMNDSLFGTSDYFIVKFNDKDWDLNLNKIEQNTTHFYPNPAFNQLNLNDFSKVETLKIYDATGKIVLFKNSLNSGFINIENYSKGLYFIEIEKDGTIFFEKLIKQ
jgi:hypothetical protein